MRLRVGEYGRSKDIFTFNCHFYLFRCTSWPLKNLESTFEHRCYLTVPTIFKISIDIILFWTFPLGKIALLWNCHTCCYIGTLKKSNSIRCILGAVLDLHLGSSIEQHCIEGITCLKIKNSIIKAMFICFWVFTPYSLFYYNLCTVQSDNMI